MRSIFNLFRRKPKNSVTIAGETFVPDPLNLEQALELSLLLAPYMVLAEDNWPQFKKALQDTHGRRPRLLSALFFSLAEKVKPQDITHAYELLLGRPIQFLARATPAELVGSLVVLDDINNFYDLFIAVQALGFKAEMGPAAGRETPNGQ